MKKLEVSRPQADIVQSVYPYNLFLAGIGSGKSSLVRNLAKLGYQTYDMDQIVKDLYRSPRGIAYVQDEYPKAIRREIGVDFPVWVSVLFDENHPDFDPNRIKRVERFFSQEAVQALQDMTRKVEQPTYVECSMLFEHIEKGIVDKDVFDYVVNVSCPDNIRFDRALFRDRDPDVVQAKMSRQWGELQRQYAASLTVPNDGDEDDLWVSTFKVIQYQNKLSLSRYIREINGPNN